MVSEWMNSRKEQSLSLNSPKDGKTIIIQIASESNGRSRIQPITHFCFTAFTSDTQHVCSDVMTLNVNLEGSVPPCYEHNTLLATSSKNIGSIHDISFTSKIGILWLNFKHYDMFKLKGHHCFDFILSIISVQCRREFLL